MFGLLAATLLPTVMAAAVLQTDNTTFPANCTRNATVALGDTCYGISAKYNVSSYQLAHVNTEINPECTNIHIGEVLCLGIKGQDCTTTYVIQYGDTCSGIAGSYGIPLSTLYANNPTINSQCSNIHHGEVLCVSSTIYPYNTTAPS